MYLYSSAVAPSGYYLLLGSLQNIVRGIHSRVLQRFYSDGTIVLPEKRESLVKNIVFKFSIPVLYFDFGLKPPILSRSKVFEDSKLIVQGVVDGALLWDARMLLRSKLGASFRIFVD